MTPQKISLKQVVDAATPITNWSKFAVHPFADRLLWCVVNYSRVTPNVLTAFGLILSAAAGALFWRGDHLGFLAGGIAFYLSFALDTIDGSLARLTGSASKLGAFLDIVGDYIRSAIASVTLVFGVLRGTDSDLVAGLGLSFVALTLAHYHLAEVSMRVAGARAGVLLETSMSRSDAVVARVVRRLGLVPTPFGLADYEAVAFVIAPVLGMPVLGMTIALVVGGVVRLTALVVVVRRLLAG